LQSARIIQEGGKGESLEALPSLCKKTTRMTMDAGGESRRMAAAADA